MFVSNVRLRVAALLLVALALTTTGVPSAGAILGGAPAPSPWVGGVYNPTASTWSYMAVILTAGERCGGTLIAPQWVLTTWRCARLYGPGSSVIVGRIDLDGGGGDERQVKSIVRNRDSTGQFGTPNDLALVELDAVTTMVPVGLMRPASEPSRDRPSSGTIAGWGQDEHFRDQTRLHVATVPIPSDADCAQALGSGFTRSLQLCVGSLHLAACADDSGGPLLEADTSGRVVLAGVIDHEDGACGRLDSYARVTAYTAWIADVTGVGVPTVPRPGVALSLDGYTTLAADGTVQSFGAATSDGNAENCVRTRSCTGIAARPAGGYWISRGTCDISAFGTAPRVASPPTDERCTIAAEPHSRGLWALTPSGRIFALGGAPTVGQPGRGHTWIQLVPRVQGGYWLIAADGHVAGLGGAQLIPDVARRPIAGAAATPSGLGHWVAAKDGTVFALGEAKFYGQPTGRRNIVAIAATSSGKGYWLFDADGTVLAYGDAHPLGSATGGHGRIVGAIRR
jgi:secreted trypsin-like serine protease